MKKYLFIAICLIAFSCEKAANESDKQEVVLDKVKSSQTYREYVDAYNDYLSCKQSRPQLTQDFTDGKITGDEFREALTKNGKVCNIKKDIFNRYYRLLQAEFDKEAEAYEIKEAE
jgi:hypothetical protein